MTERKIYKKKGDASQEETKGDSPVKDREEGGEGRGARGRGDRGTRGGERGRGRGDRGGARGGRPQTTTEGGKPYYQRRNEGKEGEGDQRREKRPQKEVDENTYYYKYNYGPRPKNEKIEVTMETEVPAIIAKDQRKKQPNRPDFEKKMKEFDDQIENLRQKIVSSISVSNVFYYSENNWKQKEGVPRWRHCWGHQSYLQGLHP